jgi:hypothetical protein
MGTLQKVVGAIVALVIVARMGSWETDSSPSTNAKIPSRVVAAEAVAANPAPVKPSITEKERKKIIADATKSLIRQRDQMEKITFYSPSKDVHQTHVGAYLGIEDGGAPVLHMRTIYFGDRWVFFEKVKIMADDEIVFEKNFSRSDIVRDNADGDVWEVADFVPGQNDLLAIKKIVRAKSVMVRFEGDERRHDHKISTIEKTRLQSILKAYDELQGKL